MDITQLILDDHHEQRRLFAILEQIDRADTGVLSALWDRLAVFLELHAAAEEEIFYPALLQVGLAAQRQAGVEGETLDAIHDHNEIRDAVTEVARHQVGTDEWYAAVAAGQPGQQRPHGRGRTRGPDRFPPAGEPAEPPPTRGRVHGLRGA